MLGVDDNVSGVVVLLVFVVKWVKLVLERMVCFVVFVNEELIYF